MYRTRQIPTEVSGTITLEYSDEWTPYPHWLFREARMQQQLTETAVNDYIRHMKQFSLPLVIRDASVDGNTIRVSV